MPKHADNTATQPKASPSLPARSASATPSKPQLAFRRKIACWRGYGVMACAAVMALGCLVGLVFFARPTASALENRNLTPFPAITGERLLSGEFFTDFSLWYADTYPAREPLVATNQAIGRLHGIAPRNAFYGGNRQSDEIPIGEEGAEATLDNGLSGVASRDGAPPPDMQQVAAELENQIADGIYITDDAGYTMYYFSQDAADSYAATINEAAKKLEGKATVYSVILPTNAGVLLEPELQQQLGAAIQDQAIGYFYSRMSNLVVPVETFQPLYEHRDEYLYFRTDHHWTQLGAFYVYESFCKAKGIQPAPYEQWEELAFEPFRGAYISAFNYYQLEDNLDTVYARVPQGTNELTYWVYDYDLENTAAEGQVVRDYTDEAEDAKYQCFVHGNVPLSHIHNPAVTDGSSVLIIKDSFGNPFTSVMVDSYEDIYTFDFRYTTQDLVTFVEEHGIQDVVFENAVMFAGTYDACELLGAIIGGGNAPSDAVEEDAGEPVVAGEG